MPLFPVPFMNRRRRSNNTDNVPSPSRSRPRPESWAIITLDSLSLISTTTIGHEHIPLSSECNDDMTFESHIIPTDLDPFSPITSEPSFTLDPTTQDERCFPIEDTTSAGSYSSDSPPIIPPLIFTPPRLRSLLARPPIIPILHFTSPGLRTLLTDTSPSSHVAKTRSMTNGRSHPYPSITNMLVNEEKASIPSGIVSSMNRFGTWDLDVNRSPRASDLHVGRSTAVRANPMPESVVTGEKDTCKPSNPKLTGMKRRTDWKKIDLGMNEMERMESLPETPTPSSRRAVTIYSTESHPPSRPLLSFEPKDVKEGDEEQEHEINKQDGEYEIDDEQDSDSDDSGLDDFQTPSKMTLSALRKTYSRLRVKHDRLKMQNDHLVDEKEDLIAALDAKMSNEAHEKPVGQSQPTLDETNITVRGHTRNRGVDLGKGSMSLGNDDGGWGKQGKGKGMTGSKENSKLKRSIVIDQVMTTLSPISEHSEPDLTPNRDGHGQVGYRTRERFTTMQSFASSRQDHVFTITHDTRAIRQDTST
ncbi:hypothetical protein TREMEDRAFT_66463 [Tremella mesenterica DSM 1558]|uniref:uncharacterized protein n=1 Tax=Tremella mesenterica (strain ATCC 24925 / CBS 8224 / DSM 1558 / NBRC 9311 / NRRL Y-6157 / RJB 2259-6 / UBC 559-6) TaxID=578456 RepID=UPI00032D1932|nr:uncharacterized protein TREMEDRAFT_66463 [Tremella mesenterica DSM 1558]EIW65550.1 hypothetical protein TREMEDRAFT_66463 [Tremella mesenterica DSM 1558]